MSDSEDETFPLAQKCARCNKYLLSMQKIIPDPKHKNWYSHAECILIVDCGKAIKPVQSYEQPE